MSSAQYKQIKKSHNSLLSESLYSYHDGGLDNNKVALAFDCITQCRINSQKKSISALCIGFPYKGMSHHIAVKNVALTKQQVPSPCLRAHTLHLP